MFLECGCERDNVIYIHQSWIIVHSSESLFHHLLEDNWWVSQPEGDPVELEEAWMADEGGLVLAIFIHLQLPETRSHIHDRKQFCFSQKVCNILEGRKWIVHCCCDCVEFSVIYGESVIAIFLFHHDYWACKWTSAFSDNSVLQHCIHLFVYFCFDFWWYSVRSLSDGWIVSRVDN